MDQIKQLLRANKDWRDERAALYGLAVLQTMKKPSYTERDIEAWITTELGDIKNKKLLYLQAYIGQGARALARRGALVTGVDNSPHAVVQAKKLTTAHNLKVDFIESELDELTKKLNKTFDIVYSSPGSLLWLPDLKGWANSITKQLKKGGFIYIADFHPFALTLDPEKINPRIAYPYFMDGPKALNQPGSYVATGAEAVHQKRFEWPYTLGEVVSSLIEAGLAITWLHEHPGKPVSKQTPVKSGQRGRLDVTGAELLPMLFSLKATKL